jgi:hypothetical protein
MRNRRPIIRFIPSFQLINLNDIRKRLKIIFIQTLKAELKDELAKMLSTQNEQHQMEMAQLEVNY